jgi:hypothetical protein
MKKDKDFSYYGRKRFKVQRYLRMFKSERINILYLLIPLVLVGLIFDIETNFSFTFSVTGGIVSLIFLFYLMYCCFSLAAYVILVVLDKYYFKKRKELFEKYLAEKGTKDFVTGE